MVTATETVLKTLDGRKRPVTASTIAQKTGLNPGTVRTALNTLTYEGKVKTAGRIYGNMGRPPQTYLPAA
ncbi:MAG: helix-turn-helix domain-containing protein [Patescibacteria group bacterium]|nr:helix-turn-helix domain-containing protein [Patescibacteria group bacterium]